jgi:hypothetical protein
MAITLETVGSALDQFHVSYLPIDDDNIALAPLNVGGAPVQVGLTLAEDGRYLQIRTYQLIAFPEGHPRLGEVLDRVGRLNNKYKLVKIGWDPKDGEICVEVGLPLVDNPSLPASQLRRALAGIGLCARDVHRELSAPSGGSLSRSLPAVPRRETPVPSARALPPAPRTSATRFLVALAAVLFGVAALLVAAKHFLHR